MCENNNKNKYKNNDTDNENKNYYYQFIFKTHSLRECLKKRKKRRLIGKEFYK